MNTVVIIIVAAAVSLLIVTRSGTRRYLRARFTRTDWAKSLAKADPSADLGLSASIKLYITTSGPYSPGYVALIPIDEPAGHVVVAIADPDSRAALPREMGPDGVEASHVASFVAEWGLRGINEQSYRDAVLARHFRNVLTDS